MATKITFQLSGLFGKSGRYYEFSQPLEVIVEQDELGNWIHWLNALEIFSAEPTRVESMHSLMQIMDEHYEAVGLPGLKFTQPLAVKQREQLLRIIKHVY